MDITVNISQIVINISSNNQNLNSEQMANLKEKLADLKAQVNERDTLQASLLTYTEGLLQQVKDAVANSADLQEALNEIDAITEQTKTDNSELVKALQANTPATTGGGTTPAPAETPATDSGATAPVDATTPPATDGTTPTDAGAEALVTEDAGAATTETADPSLPPVGAE